MKGVHTLAPKQPRTGACQPRVSSVLDHTDLQTRTASGRWGEVKGRFCVKALTMVLGDDQGTSQR